MIDKNTRITPKFSNSSNFKNILDFLTTYDNESLDILKDMNNLDSNYSIVLDEIGKTLGVYPRPYLPITIDGSPLVFTLGLSQLGTVPFAGKTTSDYRLATNNEYSKILRVFAKGINFRGTIQEWEDIVFYLTGAKCYFNNQASHFSLTIYKSLTIVEKKIIEYVLSYNSLTVSISYDGTISGTPLYLDSGELDNNHLDEGEFLEAW